MIYSKKEGFRCVGDVVVYDEKGREFYAFYPSQRVFYFNLPKGKYSIAGDVKKLGGFLPFYRKIKLPVLDKPRQPNNYKVIYEEGKGLGMIDHGKRIIYLSHTLKKNRAKKDFVLAHENGHRFYNSEAKCDIFAIHAMLKNGYNASQILAASDGLTRGNERQKLVFNTLLENFRN